MYDLNAEDTQDTVEFLKSLNKYTITLLENDKIMAKKQLLVLVRSMLNFQQEKPAVFDSNTLKTLMNLNVELIQYLKNIN